MIADVAMWETAGVRHWGRSCRHSVISCATGVAALVLVSSASALTSLGLSNVRSENRHVAASITLPANGEVWGVQVASQPGRGTEGDFLRENIVIQDFWGSANAHATQYLSQEQINVPGTYYVLAQGYDNSCFIDIFLYECGPIYSNVVPVTIEPPPPAIVVKSVRSVRRHVTVQWTLSPTAELWGVQLSRSGAA